MTRHVDIAMLVASALIGCVSAADGVSPRPVFVVGAAAGADTSRAAAAGFVNFDEPGGVAIRAIAAAPGLWLTYAWKAHQGYPWSVGTQLAGGESGLDFLGRKAIFRHQKRVFQTAIDEDLQRRSGTLVALNAGFLDTQAAPKDPYQRCPPGLTQYDEVIGEESLSSCWYESDRGEVELVDVTVYDRHQRLLSYGRAIRGVVPANPDARRFEWPEWGVEDSRNPDPLVAHAGWWSLEVGYQGSVIRVESRSNGVLDGVAFELDADYRVSLLEEWFDGQPHGQWFAFDWTREQVWWARFLAGVRTYELISVLSWERYR